MRFNFIIILTVLCVTGMQLNAVASEKMISINNEYGGKTIEHEFPGKKCTEYFNQKNIALKKICVSDCKTIPNKKVTEYFNEKGIRTKADAYLCPDYVYGAGNKKVNREIMSFDAGGARWTTKDMYYDEKLLGKVTKK